MFAPATFVPAAASVAASSSLGQQTQTAGALPLDFAFSLDLAFTQSPGDNHLPPETVPFLASEAWSLTFEQLPMEAAGSKREWTTPSLLTQFPPASPPAEPFDKELPEDAERDELSQTAPLLFVPVQEPAPPPARAFGSIQMIPYTAVEAADVADSGIQGDSLPLVSRPASRRGQTGAVADFVATGLPNESSAGDSPVSSDDLIPLFEQTPSAPSPPQGEPESAASAIDTAFEIQVRPSPVRETVRPTAAKPSTTTQPVPLTPDPPTRSSTPVRVNANPSTADPSLRPGDSLPPSSDVAAVPVTLTKSSSESRPAGREVEAPKARKWGAESKAGYPRQDPLPLTEPVASQPDLPLVAERDRNNPSPHAEERQMLSRKSAAMPRQPLPASPLESGAAHPVAVLPAIGREIQSSLPAGVAADKPVAPQSAATTTIESDLRPAEGATPPQVQGIRIPLAPEGLDRVEIQVQERQGQIEVSVRSPDTKTRSILREGLSELVTSLDKHGLTLSGQAETSELIETSPFAGESAPESVEQVKDMSREESLDSDSRQQRQREGAQHESNGQSRRRRTWQEWMNHMEDVQWWTR